MKRSIRLLRTSVAGFGMLMLAALGLPSAARASDTYTAYVGGETKDEAVQADAFLPNELWIVAGDSITWKFVPKNEPHTVTLLANGQVRPAAPPPAGPPFPAAINCTAAASYNGSACVSTQTGLSDGATFTVRFPTAGNYKLVCLIHTDMNGTVHVLPSSSPLVHSQRSIDDQAHDELQALLSDDNSRGDDDRGWGDRGWDDRRHYGNTVTAGIGEVVTTGGGLQYRAVVRFLPGTIRIHAGESVVWTNLDPTEPHTITFGSEPAGLIPTFYSLPPVEPYVAPGNPVPPFPSAVPKACTALILTDCQDQDTGTVLATINCTPSGAPLVANTSPCSVFDVQPPAAPYASLSFLNSGFLQAQAPDRVGLAQLPPGTTRISITFPNKGTYYYHCALHDVVGMLGEVIVE